MEKLIKLSFLLVLITIINTSCITTNQAHYLATNTGIVNYDEIEFNSDYTFQENLLIIYDYFPNMDNSTFLIDKELKVIQGTFISEFIRINGEVLKYKTKFKVRNTKITFFQPEIFYTSIINSYPYPYKYERKWTNAVKGSEDLLSINYQWNKFLTKFKK